ncbi:MAG: aspartate-semialdehyde dehydrogenase [Synergistaceae bacterium]|jgi:aspartate-semialdehyde dehydrogenase|nr:aspartate-semialdehyde dehydrogenase [Synergistaceae bacterium]
MPDMDKTPRKVAVLGATGLVGREILKVLEQRNFPVSELVLLASERSAGKTLDCMGHDHTVTAVNDDSFKGVDVALFSAGASTSRRWAPIAAAAGATVIDNSSAWRMDTGTPLVVPEVNPEDIKLNKGIIANPNCSTIQAVVALYPLHKKAGLNYLAISTYQSVSGTGQEALKTLESGSRDILAGNEPTSSLVYPHPIAFDLLPHIGPFDEDGISEEEWKMVRESRKIMHIPDLRVSCTAVRAPIFRGHGESIVARFDKPLTPGEVRSILKQSPGVELQDDPGSSIYPRPRYATGKDPVYVGRIRKDTGIEGAIAMWVVSDNLRKGAALNAVQIAELL